MGSSLKIKRLEKGETKRIRLAKNYSILHSNKLTPNNNDAKPHSLDSERIWAVLVRSADRCHIHVGRWHVVEHQRLRGRQFAVRWMLLLLHSCRCHRSRRMLLLMQLVLLLIAERLLLIVCHIDDLLLLLLRLRRWQRFDKLLLLLLLLVELWLPLLLLMLLLLLLPQRTVVIVIAIVVVVVHGLLRQALQNARRHFLAQQLVVVGRRIRTSGGCSARMTRRCR